MYRFAMRQEVWTAAGWRGTVVDRRPGEGVPVYAVRFEPVTLTARVPCDPAGWPGAAYHEITFVAFAEPIEYLQMSLSASRADSVELRERWLALHARRSVQHRAPAGLHTEERSHDYD